MEAAWRHGKLPHLSPRKLSTSAAWQSERPTNNNTKANTQAEQTPRQRMDCYHQTSHQQQATAEITRTHIPAHSLALAPIPISTPNPPSSPKTAPCSLSSVFATLPSITSIHPAGQPAVTNAVGGGTACGCCVGDTNRHDGGHRGKGRGSCHLYGSLPAPSCRISHAVRHW